MTNQRNLAGSAGFTLIEVVVAVAILALCTGAMLEIFGDSLKRSRQSRDYEGALALGETVLDRLRTGDIAWTRLQWQGESVPYRWEIDVADEPPVQRPGSAWQPVEVAVTVFRDDDSAPLLFLRSIEMRPGE
jgi:general secretion pathway protein I